MGPRSSLVVAIGGTVLLIIWVIVRLSGDEVHWTGPVAAAAVAVSGWIRLIEARRGGRRAAKARRAIE